jgi:2-C-methyl-D-erythritol 4-phosphate cytidylyltransferase
MTESEASNIAVVLASGGGSRFRAEIPKQFMKVAGKTVLEHTLDSFQHHPRIEHIIIACAEENRLLVEELVNSGGYLKVAQLVNGGMTRQASSASAIAAIRGDGHKVLVHDAVRPLLDRATIDRCLDALDSAVAVDTAIPASDTIIRVDANELIDAIPDRASLRLGQTPQAFRAGVLREAHRRAAGDASLKVTDDCALILHYRLGEVKVVAGDVNNIKITYPSDIYLADRLFQLRMRDIASSDSLDGLAGKTLVVFGASRGIGLEVAELAQTCGANVIAVSRASGIDVADNKAVAGVLRRAVEAHGGIDMVVNTAGVLHTGLLAGQSYERIDEQIATNLRGSVVVARESGSALSHGGSIALFTSSSYTRGRARSAVYSATKAAIVNLVQGLAQEFHSQGIRINAINPERTATPMRTENFGIEPATDLLDAQTVARATLSTLLSDSSGEVVGVRLR